ncbi:MAG: CoA-binding protein, partial [Bacteroidetes bacterium]
LLTDYEHPVYAFGLRKGMINDIEIKTEWPESEKFNTITMYVGSQHQVAYYDRILALNSQRVIFNPGTENIELSKMLKEKGIEVVENCTLVMLNGGLF